MDISKLVDTAQAMVGEGHGILAIDESQGTIKKRFDGVGVESTEDNRRNYRSALLTTPGLGDHISGAILFDETLRQSTPDGRPLVQVMQEAGIIPGIKVDKGAKALAGHPGEKVTEGLDGLRERFAEYSDLGARFAKWRAVIGIGEDIPTSACIEANAHALARYAALAQESDLVPIVEPEVLMNGNHDLDTAYEVTEATLRAVFNQLFDQGVVFEGTVLKASMVISGDQASDRAGVEEVADATLSCLLNTVPAAVAGIVFLSGGQDDQEATAHLDAMNRMGDFPWPLSFSFGRALQQAALKTWSQNMDQPEKCQKVLKHRAEMNGLAAMGQYDPEQDKVA